VETLVVPVVPAATPAQVLGLARVPVVTPAQVPELAQMVARGLARELALTQQRPRPHLNSSSPLFEGEGSYPIPG
jgi:hypothetical protein